MRLFIFILLISSGCKQAVSTVEEEPSGMDLSHIPAMNPDSTINVLIEIPAGSIEKWEYNKKRQAMEMDTVHGKPRKISYLGYPAHYGMIPNTLSAKAAGGDGDALDVIMLGEIARSHTIEECKVLGVLMLRDRGERDDKLIAAQMGSPFAAAGSLAELRRLYPGLLDIIETWFLNYKGLSADGTRLMSSCGYGDRGKALEMVGESIR